MTGLANCMLNEEYERTLEAISIAKPESSEARWQLEKLNVLHKQMIDEEKASEDHAIQERETALKEKQIAEGKKDRIIKIVLEGAAILIPPVVTSYWMAKGMEFEETGSYSSKTAQWLSSHMRLFRK